jgi:hypothetical protein
VTRHKNVFYTNNLNLTNTLRISGNSQGKMQPLGILGGHAKKDYLMKKFQNGQDIFINIPLPRREGA